MEKLLKIANKIDKKNSQIADVMEKISMRPFYPEHDVKDWDAYRNLLEITGERDPIKFYTPPSGHPDGRGVVIIPQYSRNNIDNNLNIVGTAYDSGSDGIDEISKNLLRSIRGKDFENSFDVEVSDRPFGSTMRHEDAHFSVDDLPKQDDGYWDISSRYKKMTPLIPYTARLLHSVSPEEIRANIVSAIKFFKQKGYLPDVYMDKLPLVFKRFFGWDDVMIMTVLPMIRRGGIDYLLSMNDEMFEQLVQRYHYHKFKSVWDNLDHNERKALLFSTGRENSEGFESFRDDVDKFDDILYRLSNIDFFSESGNRSWELFKSALLSGKIILDDISFDNYQNFSKFIYKHFYNNNLEKLVRNVIKNYNFVMAYYTNASPDNLKYYSDEIRDQLNLDDDTSINTRLLKIYSKRAGISPYEYFLFFKSGFSEIIDLFAERGNADMIFDIFTKVLVSDLNDVHFDVDKTVIKIADDLAIRIYDAMPYRVVQGGEYLPYN